MRCVEPSPTLQLSRRNLYILPSRFGGLWCLSAGVIYLLGIQSRSSTPLLLAYLMGGLMLLALFLTHENLSGLSLRALDQPIGFAGQLSPLALEARSSRRHSNVQVRWLSPGAPPALTLHLPPGRTMVTLPWRASHRGRCQPGPLLISTTAPLGLFRCWSRWMPAMPVTVAPQRRAGPVRWLQRRSSEGDSSFDELTPWRPELGLSRLDWKAQARGRGDLCKTFSDDPEHDPLCAPDPQLPPEQALEHVCDCLCRLAEQGRGFGLVLPPGTHIAPAEGSAQLQRCLTALALAPADPTP